MKAIAVALLSCLTMIPTVSYAQSASVVQAVTRADNAHLKNGNPIGSFKIANVTYKSGYALTMWLNGEAGGMDVLHLQNGTWHSIGGGGGALDADSMTSLYHVPTGISKALVSHMNS